MAKENKKPEEAKVEAKEDNAKAKGKAKTERTTKAFPHIGVTPIDKEMISRQAEEYAQKGLKAVMVRGVWHISKLDK